MVLLKKQDRKFLETLINLDQARVKHFFSYYLRKQYKKVIETKDYLIAEGNIPIALVAHLDTVFEENIKREERQLLYDTNYNIAFCTQGAGFDDKAGLFIIYKLVQSGLKPHIILTTDEEIGGIGAQMLSSKKCPFSNLRYIIQLDRRGSNDCVFYDCDNPEFIKYIESFGFIENFGSFSDISFLCPEWQIAGVNLSVGYQNEHTEQEILYVNQLFATIDKVQKMLAQPPKNSFKYIPAKRYFKPLHPYAFGTLTCSGCGKEFLEEELFPVVMQNQDTGFYCPDCVVDKASWCAQCNNAYEKYSPEEPTMGLCPFCAEEKYYDKN